MMLFYRRFMIHLKTQRDEDRNSQSECLLFREFSGPLRYLIFEKRKKRDEKNQMRHDIGYQQSNDSIEIDS